MSDDDKLERAAAMLDGDEAEKKRQAEVDALGEQVIEAIRTIYDPEIPVNIFELGLIYKVDIEDDNKVRIDMTLTSPHCPVAEILPEEVRQKVFAVDGVTDAEVDIVWEPPWHPGLMTEEAQLELGIIV
ncbi:MAG: SUF system Fe-S cluster assembly protein [Alphaproteobacteria bacterium]|nr:SUF system Fe-S cluster assembly protein [Alphaproteobacteria bacterium]